MRSHRIIILTVFIFLFAGWGTSTFAGRAWALDDDQARSLAHYIVGFTQDMAGDMRAAVAEYEQAAHLNPQACAPHVRLAAHYAHVGRMDEAVRELKAATKIDPDDVQARYLLALIYSTQKKTDLAVEEYEEILRQASSDSPHNAEIHSYLAQFYYSQKKFPQAISQLKSILKQEPNNSSAAVLLGSLYLDTHERGKARKMFESILTWDPKNDEALNSLAYMNAQEGRDLEQALSWSKAAIAQDPTNAAYYDSMGLIYYKMAKYPQALAVFEKANTILEDPIILEHIGDTYKAMDQPVMARKLWKRALDLSSGDNGLIKKLDDLQKTSVKASPAPRQGTPASATP